MRVFQTVFIVEGNHDDYHCPHESTQMDANEVSYVCSDYFVASRGAHEKKQIFESWRNVVNLAEVQRYFSGTPVERRMT
jgi:hypothetical protein